MKQTSHGINVFEEIDSSMSFKEWRDLIAAAAGDGTAKLSDMEIINNLFTEYVDYLKSCDGEVKSELLAMIEALQNGLDGVIEKNSNGDIVIGRNSNVIFDNGLGSNLTNGILHVLGVDVASYFRTKHYIISEEEINGDYHLRVKYNTNA